MAPLASIAVSVAHRSTLRKTRLCWLSSGKFQPRHGAEQAAFEPRNAPAAPRSGAEPCDVNVPPRTLVSSVELTALAHLRHVCQARHCLRRSPTRRGLTPSVRGSNMEGTAARVIGGASADGHCREEPSGHMEWSAPPRRRTRRPRRVGSPSRRLRWPYLDRRRGA